MAELDQQLGHPLPAAALLIAQTADGTGRQLRRDRNAESARRRRGGLGVAAGEWRGHVEIPFDRAVHGVEQ